MAPGLRISEAVALKSSDVDSQRMRIRVEHGKGGKDRYAMLSPCLLEVLRAYYRILRPGGGWLFPSWRTHLHLSAGAVQSACREAWQHSGLAKRVTPHMLRHTCAMVVLQATQDIRKVSLWLGHSNLTTTEVYVRADPTEKLEAIEAVVPPSLRKGRFRPPDKLLELLKGKP